MPSEPQPKRDSIDQLIDMVEARDPDAKKTNCLLKTRILAMIYACPDPFRVNLDDLADVLGLPDDWD